MPNLKVFFSLFVFEAKHIENRKTPQTEKTFSAVLNFLRKKDSNEFYLTLAC